MSMDHFEKETTASAAMTAPAPEKAAPIPAEVEKLANDLLAIANASVRADGSDIPLGETCRKAALVLADRADRQEERIREDARGLRGKVVYPCASFRNEDEFRDPDGYVIVKAERAEASEGRPSPMYYTLVSDTGDVRTLLSTLFTRDPARARQRGDAS